MALVDWDEPAREAFLAMQFAAQSHHYRTFYADADFRTILLDGRPVGRLVVARWEREIRIVDLALLPAHRNGGIGSFLLRGLLEEAARTGGSVTLHVERFNPALRLYSRLGFATVSENGLHRLMKWSPPGTTVG